MGLAVGAVAILPCATGLCSLSLMCSSLFHEKCLPCPYFRPLRLGYGHKPTHGFVITNLLLGTGSGCSHAIGYYITAAAQQPEMGLLSACQISKEARFLRLLFF